MAEWIYSGRVFPFHYEKALQCLFRSAAIVPSLDFGLLPSENLTVSDDGTCVHTHSNPFGHKVCGCVEQGILGCSCPRHFSDPDASFGWDRDLGTYCFGYTLYMIACHNEKFHIDLPLHFRFLDAKRYGSPSHHDVNGAVQPPPKRKKSVPVKSPAPLSIRTLFIY